MSAPRGLQPCELSELALRRFRIPWQILGIGGFDNRAFLGKTCEK